MSSRRPFKAKETAAARERMAAAGPPPPPPPPGAALLKAWPADGLPLTCKMHLQPRVRAELQRRDLAKGVVCLVCLSPVEDLFQLASYDCSCQPSCHWDCVKDRVHRCPTCRADGKPLSLAAELAASSSAAAAEQREMKADGEALLLRASEALPRLEEAELLQVGVLCEVLCGCSGCRRAFDKLSEVHGVRCGCRRPRTFHAACAAAAWLDDDLRGRRCVVCLTATSEPFSVSEALRKRKR
jgi:hypothetical protein